QYDDNSMKYFPIHILSGRLPQNDKEIIVPQHIESNGGIKYNVGDKVKLEVGKRKLPDGKVLAQKNYYYDNTEEFFPENTIEYTVVGIMERPEFESRMAPGYTVVAYLDKNSLNQEDKVDIYMLSSKIDNNIQENFTKLAEVIGLDKSYVGFNTILLDCYGVMDNQQIRNTIFTFALVMVVIIMVASISLIYNAFAISVSERIKQLGMLASVGATKKQKSENVYFEGFIVGLIGIPLGIIAGLSGIGITIKAVSPIINDFIYVDHVKLKMIISPLAILLTALFAIITIFISVYIPARRASKIMPIDAIRQSKEVKMTSKKMRTSKFINKLFGFEGEIAMKNLKRSKKKYRATIISLTISIVLFLSVSTVVLFTNKSTDIRLDIENLNFDVYIGLPYSEESIRNNVYDKIIALDLVDDYALVREATCSTSISKENVPELINKMPLQEENGKYIYTAAITAIGDEAFEKYVSSIGGNIEDYNDVSNPKCIIVNRNVSYVESERKYVESEAVKIKEGDNISFKYYIATKGEKGTFEDFDFKIGDITKEMPIGTHTRGFGEFMIVTSDTIYDSIVKQENNTSLAIKTSNGEKLDVQIQKIFKDFGVNDSSMFNSSVDAKMQKRISIVMGVFIYGFITLISLICVANIFNTVSTNIELRRKEFAMLRSIGMTPGSFKKMMNFESIFYGIKALAYGLPISAAIGFFLYHTVGEAISFSFSLPWKDYGIAIILVFIIVSATMVYSAKKLRKQNIIDALKDESY
ncbi:MAG: FtsX-like permease family protein, partial [Dysgonamonadaceae bacterium]|nr:FtsX-like permease family protein [Dysgonamonadaceae bacterium]